MHRGMKQCQIVIHKNVLVPALRSSRGASYKLLSMVGTAKFEINVSVPLVLEYEDVTKRLMDELPLSEEDVDAIIDYLCAVGNRREVSYLWRPTLGDPRDEMVLELAVTAGCDFIVTYNKRDFEAAERFGSRVVTPREFLEQLGELM
jgi:predicted nucleic acid-binding protein